MNFILKNKSVREIFQKAFDLLLLPFLFPMAFFEICRLIVKSPRILGELLAIKGSEKWFKTNNFRTVIDVGAYIGSYSYAVQKILPNVKIIAFEPIPENYSALVENLGKHAGFKAFNVALGEESGEIDFHVTNFKPSSSVLPLDENVKVLFSGIEQQNVSKVIITRLDQVLSTTPIARPSLLKIDVQGYEEAVIKGASGILDQIDWIILEISFQPLYKGQSTFHAIYTDLYAQGFELKGHHEPTLSRVDGSVIQSDIIFGRRNSLNPGIK